MKLVLAILLVLAALFLVGRVVVGRATPIKPLGVVDGKFAPCPDSPNCVSSFAPADSDQHYIAPLASTDKDTLLAILNDMPRTTIVSDMSDKEVGSGVYVHAIQKSAAWGFIDDIEFIIGDEQIDVRSASRTGHSDLDVNRKRVEQIRDLMVPR